MSKIRILALPVDREPYITNIENSLKNMQNFIGGYHRGRDDSARP